MIIHACSTSPEKKSPGNLQIFDEEFSQNPRYSDGIAEPYSAFSVAGEVKKNPRGFCVRKSTAGSMTQCTFYNNFCTLLTISQHIMVVMVSPYSSFLIDIPLGGMLVPFCTCLQIMYFHFFLTISHVHMDTTE